MIRTYASSNWRTFYGRPHPNPSLSQGFDYILTFFGVEKFGTDCCFQITLEIAREGDDVAKEWFFVQHCESRKCNQVFVTGLRSFWEKVSGESKEKFPP